MQNFSIHFTNPWLLFVLIPAIGIALIPFFKIERKYRYTRNRVCSVVLYCITMLLSVLVLAGITFTYTVANDKNEIILLVDVSDTQENSQQKRDDFVQTVLLDGRYDNYNIGVVTFGFTQEYAVPLTNDVNSIYEKYITAQLPDTTATDIAAALKYTKDLFTNPETGKIVLVTDGKETDEKAMSVIRSVASSGIAVDVADIESVNAESEIQITDVTLPDYHVSINTACSISVNVMSTVDDEVKFELYDNGELDSSAGVKTCEIIKGSQNIVFEHTFTSQGLHEIELKAIPKSDALEDNNQFNTYLYLEVFNKVLVLDRYNDSTPLQNLLTQDEKYDVTVKNIFDDDVPQTVEDLREYDQVILNNIANNDFPEGFDEKLYSYVSDYGGGLFTTGGNDESGNAHAYNRADMYGTLYQQMLPVQVINYTPPVGVIVIIDRSGSMDSAMDDGVSMLDWATAGAASCLDALTERDYFGVMTLESDYNTILSLTPVTQRAKILSAIASIGSTAGGTVFTSAIDRAGLALRGLKSVDKRHIVIVTDGMPGDKPEDYLPIIEEYYKSNGITLSIVGIGIGESTDPTSAYQKMKLACDTGHGRLHAVTRSQDLVREMREDLNAPEIKEVNQETFSPIIYNNLSTLLNGVEIAEDSESKKRLAFTLDGFYGVKKRNSADLVIVGEYEVPIYAQWKFGKGMVGSFMCDLNGTWSSDILSNANGQQFLFNALNNLMPLANIRSNDIELKIEEENYINKLSVFTDLNEGEYLTGKITYEGEGDIVEISLNEVTEGNLNDLPCYVTVALNASNNYSRCSFVAKQGGVYTINVKKHDALGNVLSEREIYKKFSYSAEYNITDEKDEIEAVEMLNGLVEKANGKIIENLDDPVEVFEGFVTRLNRSVDPRIALIIIIIVLFLLNIAVRKFKFKWPHELIRAYKEKKNSAK